MLQRNTLILTLLLLYLSVNRCQLTTERRTLLSNTVDLDDRESPQSREIVLAGDSLVQVPNAMFKMTHILKNQLSEILREKKGKEFPIQMQRICGTSFNIATLYSAIHKALSSREAKGEILPDAVVIYCDSDM